MADVDAAGSPLKIFLNYRQEDVPWAAPMLYEELCRRFGAENIFFDNGTLQPGMDFPAEIRSRLNGPAGAFVALIGPKWLSTMDERRNRGGEDYVVTEIDLGLRGDWKFITVLVDEATLPELRRLPRSIQSLCDLQVARLRQASRVDDIEHLFTRLDQLAAELRPPAVDGGGPVGPTVIVPPVPPAWAADEHYQMLAEDTDNLVIFLGAGANADDRGGPFQPDAPLLPDDQDLAGYLAGKIKLEAGQRELAQVAQYARTIKGEPRMFSWVREALADAVEPGKVHTYLARLPKRLPELKLEERYQMIVTPKYDVALERALREARVPFDVAVYMAPGTQHAGRFVHLPWDSPDAVPVLVPNEYRDFPILNDTGELTRTVVVRINGAVDDQRSRYPWKQNYVITEDHYIDYLGGRPAEEVVPMQILAKLRQASCLFLGYNVADWRLRVFLRWIWPGDGQRAATHWAVVPNPELLERHLWQYLGVPLYQNRLSDYIDGFDQYLIAHRDELT
jgi:hypothetical protein